MCQTEMFKGLDEVMGTGAERDGAALHHTNGFGR
jgi:hypothetical protein